MSKGWPKTAAFGHFNAMALCTGCDKDATQTRITYYVLDALNGGPYRCDECRAIKQIENLRQPTQSDALQADALDFGNELIFACAGLRHEPIDTEAIFSVTWDGFPYDVTIRAAQGQSK